MYDKFGFKWEKKNVIKYYMYITCKKICLVQNKILFSELGILDQDYGPHQEEFDDLV